MARGAVALIARAGLGMLIACGDPPDAAVYSWSLPPELEPPAAPAHNVTTEAKVELGRRLFFDARLSADGRHSCSSCHDPALAFSDPKTPSRGVYEEALPRQAPSLANVGYLAVYTWSNPLLTSLEGQALVPLLAKRPAELDLADRVDRVLSQLAADSSVDAVFRRAFPGAASPPTLNHVTQALASYQRTLISASSAYDRFLSGEEAALSPAAERGRQLFFSERIGCGGCHRGRWLTDAAEPVPATEQAFHNTGLYNLGGVGAYPRVSPGLIEFSGKSEDRGKFRTPPLRNLTLTAPFMHDGSVPTLDAVIDHYAAGGRTIDVGPFAGMGAENPYKDPRIAGFDLEAGDRDDLIAFLECLTDPDFVAASDSALASPPP